MLKSCCLSMLLRCSDRDIKKADNPWLCEHFALGRELTGRVYVGLISTILTGERGVAFRCIRSCYCYYLSYWLL